ncbi:MAG: hypothetical protein DRO87_04245 [Candidatus Thorarchaeota archaeon]|nr:MAG: hypothetical protein DRP09_09325 [Candidatus Thorarchaeota archaeon]RLI58974.1 MAG: hypothetical protein DRO87_04245 [Candidatus Thorarchaeota archaeon]
MREHVHDTRADIAPSSVVFESLTRRFLSSTMSHGILCPRCGASIDFHKAVEWHGPDHFSCTNCDQLLSKNLILRAINDLGLEHTKPRKIERFR